MNQPPSSVAFQTDFLSLILIHNTFVFKEGQG